MAEAMLIGAGLGAGTAMLSGNDPLAGAAMGGAMGGRHGGDNVWSFNNVSDLQSDPFGSFQNGETVRITFVNDTSFPHGTATTFMKSMKKMPWVTYVTQHWSMQVRIVT